MNFSGIYAFFHFLTFLLTPLHISLVISFSTAELHFPWWILLWHFGRPTMYFHRRNLFLFMSWYMYNRLKRISNLLMAGLWAQENPFSIWPMVACMHQSIGWRPFWLMLLRPPYFSFDESTGFDQAIGARKVLIMIKSESCGACEVCDWRIFMASAPSFHARCIRIMCCLHFLVWDIFKCPSCGFLCVLFYCI